MSIQEKCTSTISVSKTEVKPEDEIDVTYTTSIDLTPPYGAVVDVTITLKVGEKEHTLYTATKTTDTCTLSGKATVKIPDLGLSPGRHSGKITARFTWWFSDQYGDTFEYTCSSTQDITYIEPPPRCTVKIQVDKKEVKPGDTITITFTVKLDKNPGGAYGDYKIYATYNNTQHTIDQCIGCISMSPGQLEWTGRTTWTVPDLGQTRKTVTIKVKTTLYTY